MTQPAVSLVILLSFGLELSEMVNAVCKRYFKKIIIVCNDFLTVFNLRDVHECQTNTYGVALGFNLLAFCLLFSLVLMPSHRRTMLQCDKEYIKCVDVCWEESCLTRHTERRVGHTWLQVKCSESIYSDRQTRWRGCPMTCFVAKDTCTMYTDTQNTPQFLDMQKRTASGTGSED